MNNDSVKIDDGIVRFLKGQLSGRKLLTKKTFSNITVLVTYKCSARCEHCIFKCSPERQETINEELAMRFISSAARQNPMPILSFSGGEPFLRLDILRRLMSFANNYCMVSEVISSSSWCKNYKYGIKVLANLHSLGLSVYCTSVDQYHISYVAPDKIKNALAAAKAVGLQIAINTLVDPNNPGRELDFLIETLALPSKYFDSVRINPIKVVPAGRALSDINKFYYRKNVDFREGCPFMSEIITLSPTGLLYPCCGMVLGEKPELSSLFIHDDISQKSSDDIFNSLSNIKLDLFYKMIQAIGPYQFLLEIIKKYPHIQTRSKFVGSCDVCIEFTRNSDVATAAWEILDSFARHLQDNQKSKQLH